MANVPEDLRSTAENIVSEAVKLALTHMLLEAEAGHNTVKIMHALDGIQYLQGGNNISEKDDDVDIVLWNPNLSPPPAKSVAVLKGKKVSLPTLSYTEMPKISPRGMDAAIKKQQELSGVSANSDDEDTRL